MELFNKVNTVLCYSLRRLYQILILSSIAAAVGIMAWMYDYGAPIGYEVWGTTIDGQQVKLTDSVDVHLAYTPWYAASNQWRLFVNGAMGTFLGLSPFIQALSSLVPIIGGGYGLFKHFSKKKSSSDYTSRPPPDFNGGPYKFW
jgi:hypothetical protein